MSFSTFEGAITERMRIASNGNVGIGTTDTTFQNGGGLVVYNSIPRIELRNPTSGATSTDGAGMVLGGNDLFVFNKENGPINLDTNGSTRMTIKGDGDITIANTILQQAFIAPTLLNSWVNFGSGYQEVGYMKDSMGFVHIRGMIKSGTLSANIFILPAGYRPNLHILQVGSRDVGGTEDAANFQILSDGSVMATTGSTSWTSFGNISFKAG
jgi:hypothetical protein